MRLLGTIFASLTMLCLLCAPAPAQSSPAASQYQGGGSGYCPPGSLCIQSLGDGADDLSENAEQGTDAVNDAMAGTASSVSSSASEEASAPPASAASGSDADGDSRTESEGAPGAGTGKGLGSITRLPETGGAPLAALGSGMLLASGLVLRRIVG